MSKKLGLINTTRPDGSWLVEADMLRQMIRSYTCAEMFLSNYSEKTLADTETESSTMNKVGSFFFEWFVPEVKVVDMNMDAVIHKINELTESRLQEVLMSQNIGMEQTKRELMAAIERGKREKAIYQAKLRDLQKRNMGNIQDSVKKYDLAIEGSKFTRDAAIDTLVVGATVATGGTGGALLAISGGAGVGKGLAKYQDTSNVGAAVITGTMGAMTTLLKIPAGKMPAGSNKVATEGVIVFLDVVGDVGSDLATGKPVTEALTSATVKQVTNLGIGAAADKVNFSNRLSNVAVTRGARTPLPSAMQALGVEFGQKGAEKAAQSAMSAGVNALSSSPVDRSSVFSTVSLSLPVNKVDYVVQKV